MKNLPSISIIIPTYTSSDRYILMCILAAQRQNYPKDKIEIIVADNYSQDKTREIAKKLKVKVYLQSGKPSQACAQRNLGASKSNSDYVLFLDHDMEMDQNLLSNFAEHVEKSNGKVDAWFVPEKIIASSKLMTTLRNFERSFYDGTVVDATRIIKKTIFDKTRDKYDVKMSNGPADWDMDLQLRDLGAKFDIIDKGFTHHEEKLRFWRYISKKGMYVSGANYYENKWTKRAGGRFLEIVKKQQSLGYRFFGIFLLDGKWKKTLANLHLFMLVLIVRFLIGVVYLNAKRKT